MGFRIIDFKLVETNSNVKAFATIEVGPFVIYDIKVIKQDGCKAYCVFPQLKLQNNTYVPIIKCIDGKIKNIIFSAILDKWNATQTEQLIETQD